MLVGCARLEEVLVGPVWPSALRGLKRATRVRSSGLLIPGYSTPKLSLSMTWLVSNSVLPASGSDMSAKSHALHARLRCPNNSKQHSPCSC